MWNSLYVLEQLYEYRSTSDGKKRKVETNILSSESIKIDLINALTADEINRALANARTSDLDTIRILEEVISSGRISKPLLTEFYTSFEKEKQYDHVKNMRYRLGKGTYATVYRVNSKKVVKENLKVFKNEVEVLRKLVGLSHSAVLEVFHMHENRTIYEFLYSTSVINPEPKCMELFDLVDKTYSNHSARLAVVFNNNLMIQLFEGVQFLHSKNIFHRDLKPENVMVTGIIPTHITVKIIDFNLSLSLEENSEIATETSSPGRIGSPAYVSLQYKDFNRYKNKKLQGEELQTVKDILMLSDMWSFAIICWTLIYAGNPWSIPFLKSDNKFRYYVTNRRFHISDQHKHSVNSVVADYDVNSVIENLLNLLWTPTNDEIIYFTCENKDLFYSGLITFLNLCFLVNLNPS